MENMLLEEWVEKMRTGYNIQLLMNTQKTIKLAGVGQGVSSVTNCF